jgi:hypothetical protein
VRFAQPKEAEPMAILDFPHPSQQLESAMRPISLALSTNGDEFAVTFDKAG